MKAMKCLILCLVLLCGVAVWEAQAPERPWAFGSGETEVDHGESFKLRQFRIRTYDHSETINLKTIK